MKTIEIGRLGENAAADLLKKRKFKVVGRNVHVSHNEIDIVAVSKRHKIIVFSEVKTRSVDQDLYSPFGSPASAVNKEKRLRTLEAARGFIKANFKYHDFQPRFDVIEVYLDRQTKKILKINHIEDAFGV